MKYPCPRPGCPNLLPCPTHPPKSADTKTSDERKFYSSTWWKKASLRHRRHNPMCAEHLRQGKFVPGKVTDHIVPIRQGGAPRDPRNWQTLCWPCHQKKRAKERQQPAA